jgi:hypothetical protein
VREWSLASMTACGASDTVHRQHRVEALKEHHMSPVEIRSHLLELAQERMAAEHVGLTADPAYMADLEAEVLEYRLALVGALVTEIAVFRGELFGRNVG